MKLDEKLMKEEAIKRLKYIDASEKMIADFKNDIIYTSDNGDLREPSKKEKEIIQMLKEQCDTFVYYVIYTPNYHMISFLYVADQEEWAYDRDDLKAGFPMAYVCNYLTPQFSEFGSISIKETNGVLDRIM